MSKPKIPTAAQSLQRQIAAAKVLLANLKDVLGDDSIARADAVEGETGLHETIEQALGRIIAITALEAGIDKILADLNSRAARLAEQKEGLRTSLTVAMELAELPDGRLETALGTISLKRIPAKLDVTDEATIPARFFKSQDPKLDKAALTAALRANEIVPGAQLDNGSLTIQLKLR